MGSPVYSSRFDRAVSLAIDSFRHVRRKGSDVPYVTHLLMVCAIVGEHGGDEDQLIAAVLHDYLEDIEGASEGELREAFGDRVTGLVLALSDTTDHPKPPWVERKQAYVARLRDEPHDAKLICAADKLHNCRTIIADHGRIGEAIFDRFKPSKDQTLWYYRTCLDALGDGWDHPILIELDRAVRQLHTVAGASF